MGDLRFIELPPLVGGQAESWSALVVLAPAFGDSWLLVGGQMVLLHEIERGALDTRPTDDVDVVVDLRVDPSGLDRMHMALVDERRQRRSLLVGHSHADQIRLLPDCRARVSGIAPDISSSLVISGRHDRVRPLAPTPDLVRAYEIAPRVWHAVSLVISLSAELPDTGR